MPTFTLEIDSEWTLAAVANGAETITVPAGTAFYHAIRDDEQTPQPDYQRFEHHAGRTAISFDLTAGERLWLATRSSPARTTMDRPAGSGSGDEALVVAREALRIAGAAGDEALGAAQQAQAGVDRLSPNVRKINTAPGRAPLPTDDGSKGFEIGSRWQWMGHEWIAASVAAGAASWLPSGGLTARHFGASGAGIVSDRAALAAAFQFAANTGLRLTIPAGEYRLDDTLSWTMNGDTHIVLHPAARFVAASSFGVDKRLVQPMAGSARSRLIWEGGVLDGRAMPVRATGAPDLFYCAGDISVTIRDVEFISNDTRSTKAGDSHLFLAEGEDYRVEGCKFTGAVDSAIYISGDNTGTKGRRAYVTGCTFLENSGCVIFKRQFEEVAVTGNVFENCGNGVTLGGEVDSVVGLLTASKGVISGNIFRSVLRPIEARIAHGTIITDNRIENHGTTADGTEIAESGIIIAGSNRCIVAGNHIIRGRPNPHASLFGIRLVTRVWEGVTYTSNGNLIHGNIVAGTASGVHEAAGCDGNFVDDTNRFTATSPVVLVGPSSRRGGPYGYSATPSAIQGYVQMTDDQGVVRKIAVLT